MKKNIENSVNKLLDLLQSQLEFANCHMVEYFTNSLWEKYIPKLIRDEIELNSFEHTLELLQNRKPLGTNFQNLSKFLSSINDIVDSTVVLNLNNFLERISKNKNIDVCKFEHFMSEKKVHEVNQMAALCADLSKIMSINNLVDIGDGKGYLSSLLALKYDINMLGIDASSVNTLGSTKRLQKLKKYWNGLNKTRKNLDQCPYKQITCFVTNETDLLKLCSDNFNTNIEKLGLIGLHTCGNLASNILRLYTNNSNVRMLCNVGCCYHLINEEFSRDEYGPNLNNPIVSYGFPLSNYLQGQNIHIGRNARMLASQSLDRNQTNFNKSLFYRALFQVFLKRKLGYIPDGQVGRKCSNIVNFYDYIVCALQRYNLANIDLDINEINCLFNEFQPFEQQLNVFYLLRMRLAIIIELFILTDRLLYLYENDFNRSYLVKLFEPSISPRHIALISFKNVQ